MLILEECCIINVNAREILGKQEKIQKTFRNNYYFKGKNLGKNVKKFKNLEVNITVILKDSIRNENVGEILEKYGVTLEKMWNYFIKI